MLSFVFNKDIKSCAETAIYIMQFIAKNFATKRDIVLQ